VLLYKRSSWTSREVLGGGGGGRGRLEGSVVKRGSVGEKRLPAKEFPRHVDDVGDVRLAEGVRGLLVVTASTLAALVWPACGPPAP